MDNLKYSPEMAQTLSAALNWLTMKGHSPSLRWEHWTADKPVITIHVRTFTEDHKFLDAIAVSISEPWQIDRFAAQWQAHVDEMEATLETTEA